MKKSIDFWLKISVLAEKLGTQVLGTEEMEQIQPIDFARWALLQRLKLRMIQHPDF